MIAKLADSLHMYGPPTLTTYFQAMPGETHATIYHPAALLALRALFKPVP
jgi:hypothetical protein